MNLPDLLASIAATNNGYLFAPTAPELACARLHPEAVTISHDGIIAPRGFVIPRYPDPAAARGPHARNYPDDFDYEGAILARQQWNI